MKNHFQFYHNKKWNITPNKKDFGKKLSMSLKKILKNMKPLNNLNNF